MTVTPSRRIALAGAFNFRDLGGYPTWDGRQTRWGRIFRSSTLHRLTDEDVATIGALGVRTVFDLRSPTEWARDRSRLHDHPGICHIHRPITVPSGLRGALDVADPQEALSQFRMVMFYRGILDENAAVFRELFALLADPAAYPLVFHCQGGKDRAGITAALILRAAGVPDETIIADYALSSALFEPHRARAEESLRSRGVPLAAIKEVLGTEPEWMAETLAYLDASYGSTEEYLQRAGVTAAELEAFRAHFVE